jgi:hypothetical protein
MFRIVDFRPDGRQLVTWSRRALLLPSACGLLAAFFDLRAFLAGLAFFAAVRLPFACGALVSDVSSVSPVFVLMVLLLDRVAVVTFITPVGGNSKRNLRRLCGEANGARQEAKSAGWIPF